ncbi:hypothetical protein F4859DRAFT_474638 [Xylaria cf. heliscus]|nr:hypothetical protein F4859DRAFT_474638 [Xylaria cf. heliscus]
MSDDPVSRFGLACPSGGKFYICQDSHIGFLGCCGVDPCSSGCPSSALYPATFNSLEYDGIAAQSCADSVPVSLWYTCKNGPTFFGCCTSNPCNNNGVCPKNDLTAARLADDPLSASAFLTPTAATTISSATSTPTSTGESTSTQVSSPAPTTESKGSSSAPTAAIVGGVLGGLIALLLIAFILFRYRRRKGRELAAAQPEEEAVQSPWSPYHDSFRGSPTIPPAPVSPLSMDSRRHKSMSPSLSSIIGFKRGSTPKRESFQESQWVPGMHDSRQASPRFLSSVAELESLPPGGIMVRGELQNTVHYEVEGSTVGVEPK